MLRGRDLLKHNKITNTVTAVVDEYSNSQTLNFLVWGELDLCFLKTCIFKHSLGVEDWRENLQDTWCYMGDFSTLEMLYPQKTHGIFLNPVLAVQLLICWW